MGRQHYSDHRGPTLRSHYFSIFLYKLYGRLNISWQWCRNRRLFFPPRAIKDQRWEKVKRDHGRGMGLWISIRLSINRIWATGVDAWSSRVRDLFVLMKGSICFSSIKMWLSVVYHVTRESRRRTSNRTGFTSASIAPQEVEGPGRGSRVWNGPERPT